MQATQQPNESRVKCLNAAQLEARAKLLALDPVKYAYCAINSVVRVEQMTQALWLNQGSKDGPAIKAALKALGIRPTYTAIRDYLAGGNDYAVKPRKKR